MTELFTTDNLSLTYDSEGRLYSDTGRDIDNIVYAPNDMPMTIFGPYNRIKAQYAYAADGRKLSVAYGHSYTSAITETRYYVGSFQFTNNSTVRTIRLERVNLPWGFFDQQLTPMVNLTDYQGNIRAVFSQYSGYAMQTTDYYPYGLPKATSTNPTLNTYKYGGKELSTDFGLTSYDFDARLQLRFSRPDPQAWDAPWNNTYLYCSANPVNRIDPDGEADFFNGDEYWGNDGKLDGKIYVLKISATELKDGEHSTKAAGLSSEDISSTKDFIEKHSGKTSEFNNNSDIYNNFIEIEPSRDNRIKMAEIVSKDTGTKDDALNGSNNREYGGTIQNGKVIEATPGPITDPTKAKNTSISLPSGYTSFHSHPSGRKSVGNGMSAYYVQIPSAADFKGIGNNTGYVFGRAKGDVYIFTSEGVQAKMSQSQFTKIKYQNLKIAK